MKGRNRKTKRIRNKPARDAFRRRVAREKPQLSPEAARFFVAEAAAPEQEKK